jgi:poly(3-hydroxybutyrate) depolymerase/transglutaminase-like putative cysteine protease
MRPFALVLAVLAAGFAAADPPAAWWPAEVEKALARAGGNRPELEKALHGVARDERPGMAFLVAHMPERDLTSLKADFLVANTRLAYRARRELPWGKDVPDDVFLNDVLPYANVDERRDAWRQEFFDLCLPLVKDCKTPAEAAVRLNTALFPKLKVGYSTGRRAANQSPFESIEQGKASCTGLSIILADACRAVCVPARLAGTPNWSDKRGNHTWVEVWDRGWHFTGACEPDPRGLDFGWFTADAARAQKDAPEHAIYAASFRHTGTHFPLVWDRRNTAVPGVNVTTRYAKSVATDAARSAAALAALKAALADPAALDGLAKRDTAAVPLTKADAAAARDLIWAAHVAKLKAERGAEMKARVLKDGDAEMPFDVRTFGAAPPGGRSLWISMHGGGGAPKQVNDQQWENQKKLYTLDEGLYVAPRAPTNTWNLWHQPHIDTLFARLIEDMVALEGVNPDKVYLLGYSAGGDGAYQMAPRMADRWAAAAMMAGHPNGVSLLNLRNVPFALQVGEKDSAYKRNEVAKEYGAQLAKLRLADPGGYENLVRIHAGKGHWMDREDKLALPWMAKFSRNPVPDRVVWKQMGTAHDRSYWLAVPPTDRKADALVTARRDGQTVDLTAAIGVKRVTVRFDDRVVDLDRPVRIVHDGKELYNGTPPRTAAVLAKTLAGRGDPRLMFAAEVTVDVPAGP